MLALIIEVILFQVNAADLMARKRDIGIMQTVGWTRRNIGAQIISEVFLQTILGCILGIIVQPYSCRCRWLHRHSSERTGRLV